MKFEIVTDSSCNLTEDLVDKWNVNVIPMTYTCEGQEYKSHLKGDEANLGQFYSMMREGKEFKTSFASEMIAENIIRKLLDQGKDVLYLGFSSQLSSSFDAISLLMNRLSSEYPDRRLAAVDSLSASAGQGMLVVLAAEMSARGYDIETVRIWLENHKLNCAHWFTVDDLTYLLRGGRITKTTALAGSLLNAKPVMHVDDSGRLIHVTSVRGRKKSIRALVDRMEETALRPVSDQLIFITHGDCLDDAEALANEVKRRLGATKFVFNYVDPVIGAHAGPGVLALFYMAEHR